MKKEQECHAMINHMENNLKNEKEILKNNIDKLIILHFNLCMSSTDKLLDVNASDILQALEQSIALLSIELKEIEDYEELIQHEESWTE